MTGSGGEAGQVVVAVLLRVLTSRLWSRGWAVAIPPRPIIRISAGGADEPVAPWYDRSVRSRGAR